MRLVGFGLRARDRGVVVLGRGFVPGQLVRRLVAAILLRHAVLDLRSWRAAAGSPMEPPT